MPKSTIARVNAMLQAAGRAERLVRHGAGYYYVSGVAVSSSLYVYLLGPDDLAYALEHVADVLSREDGRPFTFPRA